MADKTSVKKISAEASLLGSFSLKIGGSVITDELNRSIKIWNLLAYLLVNRHRNIPQSEFIEVLWPDDEDGNPLGALKALFFRLRRMIMSTLGEEINLFISQRGSYSWNRNIKCTLDAEDFEKKCLRAAQESLSVKQRIILYKDALSMYKGPFYPKLSDQLWVVPIAEHYRSLYFESVKNYAMILENEQLYTEIINICLTAIRIDPLDEDIHILLLRSYLKQGNNSAALTHYEQATSQLYRSLGVRPSERLLRVYYEIMKMQKSFEPDLGVIQKSLREYDFKPGAFVCEFGFFREAYRLFTRQAVRDGASIHIVLISVALPDGHTPPIGLLNDSMDSLLEEIMFNLRRGDVVSRYSGTQYIMLLPYADYDNSLDVVNKIRQSFSRHHRYNRIRLNCTIQPIDLSEPGISSTNNVSDNPLDMV